jgi:hypothetical protein
MGISDAMIDAFYELLVENATMKRLLLGLPDLNGQLERAKVDPANKQLFGDYLEPLRTAFEDEVANETLIREIFSRIPPDSKSH